MNSMRVVALGVLLSSGLAAAGSKTDYTVDLSTANRYASATMGGARNSSDSTQLLSCQIDATVSGISGTCYAVNAQGVSGECRTTNQYLLEAIKSISDSSLVAFTWNESGVCTQVIVRQGSMHGPKL
ncbi:hypothetical protein [Myxococcus qinghaiensis]|uniref:hypothetical protein n=1 Tax=Myxococcus qinghaiensis TaxID=2906758 RepID=UPI0020A70A43|nr:hypothetical protein [Myxococcus qinghaiensis]MCP3165518.1 hypothetical protein [Myxococcus qinghaiensis]